MDKKRKDERKFRKFRSDKYKEDDRYYKAAKNDENPVVQEDKVLRCFRCDSTRHFLPKCKHKQNQSKYSYYNETQATLYTSSPDERQLFDTGNIRKGST